MKFRIWLIKYLMEPIIKKAMDSNDHQLADNVIVVGDALDEIARKTTKCE